MHLTKQENYFPWKQWRELFRIHLLGSRGAERIVFAIYFSTAFNKLNGWPLGLRGLRTGERCPSRGKNLSK